MEWRDSLTAYHNPSSDELCLAETRTPDGILIPQADFSAQAK